MLNSDFSKISCRAERRVLANTRPDEYRNAMSPTLDFEAFLPGISNMTIYDIEIHQLSGKS
jgi:hypothetical protein